MSYTEDSIIVDSPKVIQTKKRLKRNVIDTTPSHSSREDKKSDIIEMFTIKSQSSYPARTRSSSQDTSELSDTVFLETNNANITNKKSYRNKINERFQEIRKKVGKSTKKADVFKENVEIMMTERVRKESNNIDHDVEDARQKLHLGRTSYINENRIFFCDVTEESNNEDKKEEVDIIKYVYPEKMAIEDGSILKNKKTTDAAPDNIIEEISNLQEQGLYVPKLPKILLEQEQHILEKPIIKTSRRPELKPLPSEQVTHFLKPQIDFAACDEIITVSDNILHFELINLQFNHHPLFNIEHVLERILQQLCEKFEKIIENDLCNRTKQKLEILRELRKKSNRTNENYLISIKELREIAFIEGKRQRDTIRAILKSWKLIKKTRNEKKYSSTSIRLVIMKSYLDYDLEKEQYDKNFEETFNEIVDNNPELDEEEIRINLFKRFRESFKPPGEPVVLFQLQYDNQITVEINESREILRKNLVKSTKIYLRIIYNNLEVCKTKSVDLANNFTCNFNEVISIKLTNICSNITVEIIEQFKSIIKKCVGKLTIKLPSQSVDFDNRRPTKRDFSNNEQVTYKHEGVGSGIKINELLKELDCQDITLYTSGSINFALFWDTIKIDTEYIYDNNTEQIAAKIIDRQGYVNLEKLSEWLKHKKPDPQDPKNTILYEYEIDNQNFTGLSDNTPNYFRLNPFSNAFEFGDNKLLDENIRLTLLQLRNRNEPEFDHMLIPNNIKEIPFNILDNYKKRLTEDEDAFLHYEEDDEIESRRINGRKQLQQIYIKIFQKCKNYENNLTYEGVVNEKILINFDEIVKGFIEKLIKWLLWNPLKRLTVQKEETVQFKPPDYHQQSVSIVVKIISVENLIGNKTTQNSEETKFSTFVEVEFNNIVVKTKTVEGSKPVWNEILYIPLESLHIDYLNPNSLSGTVEINFYNELETVSRILEKSTTRNLLGYVCIPLSAICYNRIDGTFELRTPTLTVDYGGIDIKSKCNRIFLNLEIEILPKIPNLVPSIEDLPCSEVPFIKDHALNWNQMYNTNFPDRKFSVFAIDVKGLTTCIVHYIKPVEPPPINSEGFDVTEEQCARYISLIPFVYYNQFYQNVWLSVDQFIHMMAGSVIDHAVALTCYLLALKKEVWLLLGFGIPYGATTFVLTKKNSGNGVSFYCIYDVVLGRSFSLDDKMCPLKTIFCIVNSNNVWANLQRQNSLNLIRFDLNRKSDWLPLFNNNISAPTSSIHGKITYLPTKEIHDFEIILEQKIRKKFSKLRQLQRTIWNQYISNVFKKVLNSFENTIISGHDNVEIIKMIKNQTAPFLIRGQVSNLPFTSISSIIKKIKLFGLHQQEDSKLEFALGVCIKPYPNSVLAIWLFLASVLQKPI